MASMMGFRTSLIYVGFYHLFFSGVGPACCSAVLDGCSSSCGNLGISYPFHLKGDPEYCGNPNYELECSDNRTILNYLSGKYLVTGIHYEFATIQVVDVRLLSGGCSLPFASLSVSSELYSYSLYGVQQEWVTFLNCSKKIENSTYHLIPCLSESNRFVYATNQTGVEYVLASCSFLTMFPTPEFNLTSPGDDVFRILRNGFFLSWGSKSSRSRIIHECLNTATRYAKENLEGNKWKRLLYPFQYEYEFVECIKKTWHYYDGAYALYRLALVCIVLLDIAAFLLVLAVLGRFIFAPLAILSFLAYELSKMMVPVDNIEKFLETHQMLAPKRYSYIDIVAMTKHFKEKLGRGGFGAVYKGELPGGLLVAVKMLGNSKCDGEEFINEVSTIGRIHHVNVVRLVGFCSDGSNRALVYEFMCNGSLDKYIFSSSGTNRQFSMEKLNEIALGIAKGIDYLHRGCEMRILHFDIKPHNILLDQNFNPKISDFGLAKLYPRDYSLVSACAARGTIGYMAPELVSRSFGLVSYKSDVYSFGMLLLEMAGGRRNLDPHADNSSEVYCPSWVYDQLEQREKLEVGNDIEIMNVEWKLCKVGLWCIQMQAANRPPMSKVVEMLESEVDCIDMPPRPFLFSSQPLSRRQTSMYSSCTEISTIYEEED